MFSKANETRSVAGTVNGLPEAEAEAEAEAEPEAASSDECILVAPAG